MMRFGLAQKRLQRRVGVVLVGRLRLGDSFAFVKSHRPALQEADVVLQHGAHKVEHGVRLRVYDTTRGGCSGHLLYTVYVKSTKLIRSKRNNVRSCSSSRTTVMSEKPILCVAA